MEPQQVNGNIQALQLQAQQLQQAVTVLLVIGFIATGLGKLIGSAIEFRGKL